jgi:hypothetical protein
MTLSAMAVHPPQVYGAYEVSLVISRDEAYHFCRHTVYANPIRAADHDTDRCGKLSDAIERL